MQLFSVRVDLKLKSLLLSHKGTDEQTDIQTDKQTHNTTLSSTTQIH